MDIYTTYKIPFEVGTWARGHKFDITAVKMTRKLMKLDQIETQMSVLQKEADAINDELAKDIIAAMAKLKVQDAPK